MFSQDRLLFYLEGENEEVLKRVYFTFVLTVWRCHVNLNQSGLESKYPKIVKLQNATCPNLSYPLNVVKSIVSGMCGVDVELNSNLMKGETKNPSVFSYFNNLEIIRLHLVRRKWISETVTEDDLLNMENYCRKTFPTLNERGAILVLFLAPQIIEKKEPVDTAMFGRLLWAFIHISAISPTLKNSALQFLIANTSLYQTCSICKNNMEREYEYKILNPFLTLADSTTPRKRFETTAIMHNIVSKSLNKPTISQSTLASIETNLERLWR